MGTTCIFGGVLLIVLAILGYLFTNPRKIREARAALADILNSARKSRGELQGLQTDLQGKNRVPDTAPMDEQVDDLQVGEMANIGPKKAGNPELQATGRATIIALNNLGGARFAPKGEEWKMWKFDRTALLIHRPEGWYWLPLDKRVALAPEGVEIFNREGKVFSDQRDGQTARSYAFNWQHQRLTFLDVGYFNVNLTGGDVGTQDGMLVKYCLLEDARGNIVFVANNKVGTDYVYTGGTFLGETIEPYVQGMTRAV